MASFQKRRNLGTLVGLAAGAAALALAPGAVAQDPNQPTVETFPVKGYVDVTLPNGRREMIDLTSSNKPTGILAYPAGDAHVRGELSGLAAYGRSRTLNSNILALMGRAFAGGIPPEFLPDGARGGLPTGLRPTEAVYRNPLVRRGVFDGSAGGYWDAYFELFLRQAAANGAVPSDGAAQNQTPAFGVARNTTAIRLEAGPIDASPPNAPETAPNRALRNNHYRCYAVTNARGFSAARVAATDQFESDRQLRLTKVVEVCNPTNKIHNRRTTRPLDTRRHLVGYQVAPGPKTERTVGVFNQFQNVRLDTERRTIFYAPSAKVQRQGKRNRIPRRTSAARPDHFACYSADARVDRPQTAVFFDQFERRTSRVLGANALCNPVQKVHRNRTFRIQNDDGHLVSYRVNQPSPRRVVEVNNQFGTRQRLTTGKVTRVLVPSHKRLCSEFRSGPLSLPIQQGGKTIATVTRVAFVPYGGNNRGACPGPN